MSKRMFGRMIQITGLLMIAVLAATWVASAAELNSEAVLSSSIAAPTEVIEGTNAFDIKVWATGTLNATSHVGTATVVTKYYMAASGAITPSTDVMHRTVLSFEKGHNYSQGCPSSGIGCASNPFIVSATLEVSVDADGGTSGVLQVSATGSQGMDIKSGSLDTGYVEVVALAANDETAPVLTLSQNITAEATGLSGAEVTYVASAEDDVDGTVPVVCEPASGSTFPLGETIVNCEATDAVGNKATGSFAVTVVDTTDPVISGMPSDMELEATSSAGAVASWSAPTASDLVDGTVPVVCEPASGSTFALGVTTVECKANDAAGNEAANSFSVTVEDTTAPAISGMPANMTVEATSSAGATASWIAPTANDAVDGSVAVNCNPVSGSTFALGGPHTVTCSASDTAGNSASELSTVTVVDTTAPVLDLPGDMTMEATGPSGAAVTYGATAEDVVDGTVSVMCEPASGSTFPLGETTVNCEATDAAGNNATGNFTVTVVDTSDPVISGMPSDMHLNATSSAGAVASWIAPTAMDLVDGSVPVVCVPASGTTFPLGKTTVECTAVDAAGNEANASFTVTVRYGFAGFFRPIDMGSIVNSAKAGQAIPVKFSLGGDMGLNVLAALPRFAQTPCDASAPVDLIDVVAGTAGNSGLTYDPITDQYTYVWKTDKSWAGKCGELRVTLNDGSGAIVAKFKFTK